MPRKDITSYPFIGNIDFPQVHIRVKGQLAGCSGGRGQYEEYQTFQDPCGFVYSASLNPVATSISPTNGSTGTLVTITGTGFSTSENDITVLFGGILCAVAAANYNSIQCTLGEDSAGSKPLSVQMTPLGIVDTRGIVLDYPLAITSIQPSSGSVAGGTVITLNGTGFSPSSSGNCVTRVFVGQSRCDVIDATPSRITCVTPPNPGAASLDIAVNVTCAGSSGLVASLPSGFTYDLAHTPVISGLSSAVGSGAGRETVTIYGSNFVGSGDTAVLVSVRLVDVCLLGRVFEGSGGHAQMG